MLAKSQAQWRGRLKKKSQPPNNDEPEWGYRLSMNPMYGAGLAIRLVPRTEGEVIDAISGAVWDSLLEMLR